MKLIHFTYSMIKFFRKIRLGIFSKNDQTSRFDKVSRYLLYAIGEIFLVVLGILIALYLNNMNQNNILHKKQQNHLKLIRGEMINNLQSLRDENEVLLTLMSDNRKILNLMGSEAEILSIEEDSLSSLLFSPLARQIRIEYQNGALTELISSGGLKEIKSDSVRSLLASWAAKLQTVKSQENALHGVLEESVNFVKSHGSFRTLFDETGFSDDLGIDNHHTRTSNKNLLRSQRFENILLNYLALSETLDRNNYAKFEEELLLVIRLIDTELEVSK